MASRVRSPRSCPPVLAPVPNASIRLRLREARESRRISQPELATAIGVGQTAVSQWENNVTLPTVQNLARIALALGMRLDELVETTPIDRPLVAAAG